MSINRISMITVLVLLLISISCAFDLAHVKYFPSVISDPFDASYFFSIQEDVKLTEMPCNYYRTLKKNTLWKIVGTLEEGDVYKSSDQILTLECSNVYEAYLVVKNSELVGFYLPVEDGFVPLSKPLKMPVQ